MAGRLFIFVGPSGAGKSTIAERSGLYVEPKRSTRPGRNYQELDVISDMQCDLRDNDTFVGYTNNGGHIYMFDLASVRRRLDSGEDVVIITSEPQTIRYLKEEVADVCVVFVHRPMTRDRIRQICIERGMGHDKIESDVEQRYGALITLYNDLATGVLRPDHVILNTEEDVTPAVVQFRRIVTHRRTTNSAVPAGQASDGTLFIIMAGTGAFKDQCLRFVELIPGGTEAIVPKYFSRDYRHGEDGREYRGWDEQPEHVIQFTPFPDTHYALSPTDAVQVVRATGVGFIMVSDLDAAKALETEVRAQGIVVRRLYLHQPEEDIAQFRRQHGQARLAHRQALESLYKEELILEGGIILAVTKDVLSRYMVRLYLDHRKRSRV